MIIGQSSIRSATALLLSTILALALLAESEVLWAASKTDRTEVAKLYSNGAKAYEADDWSNAARYFLRVIELQPDIAAVHTALAMTYLRMDDWQKAAAAAERAVDLDPADITNYEILYDSYRAIGNIEKMRAVIAKLVQMDPGPENAPRVFNLGVASIERGDLLAASNHFDEARELDPELLPAYIALSRVLFDLGRFGESIQVAKECLAKDAGNTEALSIVYLSLMKEGRTDEARTVLEDLPVEERSALSDLLDTAYQAGVEDGRAYERNTRVPSNHARGGSESSPIKPGTAFLSKISSAEDDLVQLEDGAVVEIASGYLGYVGYRKDAVLFKDADSWRIWIEGKRAYRCDVLRHAPQSKGRSAELVYISEVKADGHLVVLDDGTLLEVDSLHTIDTSLWLGLSEALLLDEVELINLEESSEIIPVRRLR